MQSQSDVREKIVKERNQLQRKLDRLLKFCESPEFRELLPPYRDLLMEQRGHMAGYLNSLNSRIYMESAVAAVATPTAAS